MQEERLDQLTVEQINRFLPNNSSIQKSLYPDVDRKAWFGGDNFITASG